MIRASSPRLAPLAGLLLLAACAGAPKPASAPPPVIVAPPVAPAGLDRVIGRNANALLNLFGAADQDVVEDNARKLQFGSGICILDAYLYAPARGREAVVTHIDTRQTDGRPIDKASCVAALTRRKEAR